MVPGDVESLLCYDSLCSTSVHRVLCSWSSLDARMLMCMQVPTMVIVVWLIGILAYIISVNCKPRRLVWWPVHCTCVRFSSQSQDQWETPGCDKCLGFVACVFPILVLAQPDGLRGVVTLEGLEGHHDLFVAWVVSWHCLSMMTTLNRMF